jgi:predicted RNA-binding protein with PUA-like domain
MVDVKFRKKFKRLIPLEELRQVKSLDGMELLRKGSRLSIQPVSKKHFETIVKLASE